VLEISERGTGNRVKLIAVEIITKETVVDHLSDTIDESQKEAVAGTTKMSGEILHGGLTGVRIVA